MAFSNPVSPEDNLDSIAVPLFDTLQAISYGEVGDIRLYDVGTLFWSLSRLFGCYERVITGLQYPRQQRHFLDLDLENFIIRQRVVLNDIAYIVRQLLPKDARSMGKPKGGKHPANREYSVTTLVKDLGKNSQSFPEISSAFANASEWINELKNGRDCIIHYKAKIVIFKGDPVGFAFSDPGNTAPRQSSPTGGQQLVLYGVKDYTNTSMLKLHKFMHDELKQAILQHATKTNLRVVPVGFGGKMHCIGIRTFRILNDMIL